MAAQFESLLDRVYQIHDLEKALWLLQWDREVMMPPGGAEARANQMATLGRIRHNLFVAPETGELIEAAAGELDGAPYDSFEASLIRYLRRSYGDEIRLPEDFVVRQTQVSAKANVAWKKAREQNDFSLFQPWLEQVIELVRELAGYYSTGEEDETYDVLLDKYEFGTTTAQVRAIFAATKEAILPLLQAVMERGTPVDDSFLHRHYDVARQESFARYVAAAAGYDFQRGHLGTATHPFASSFSRNDARITTRWYPDFLNPSLFGTLHESGHALYEQGTGEELARTPLARGASMGIHESQSRMMENIVGRSRGFWSAHFGRLQETFPEALGHVSLEQFYRAINRVQPSFIRVEADELTYNMHIILRFELEQAMLNGELAAADLPAAWNQKMQQLLGVVPPDNTQGCLQDIHWTRPGFGYFPTYALGNLYAAQFYEAARQQQPQIAADLAQGDVRSLLAWLRENIHRHGRKFTPGELVQQATGAPLSHEPFVRYVTAKFSEIYAL